MSNSQDVLVAANQAAAAANTAFNDGNETLTADNNKLSGNVLSNAANAESPAVESYSINGMTYKTGETAGIYGVGTFKMNSNGTYELSVEGQRVPTIKMPAVSYTVKSGGQTDDSVLNITLGGGVKENRYAEANEKADGKADLDTVVAIKEGQTNGNVLENYEGTDKPYISGFRVNNAYYASGQTIKVEGFGEVTVNRDGSYIIKQDAGVDSADIPRIAFTVTNGYNASSSDLVLRAAAGDAAAVLTDGDEKPADVSGNLLANASNTVNGKEVGGVSVTGIKAEGLSYEAGDTIQFDAGALKINANGAYEFVSNGAYTVYDSPDVTYTVSNGSKTDTSTMKVSYDYGHFEAPMFELGGTKVISGDNRTGKGSSLEGKPTDSDVIIGDAYEGKATDDTLVAGAAWAAPSSDVLAGDRLNIGHLTWKSGETTVQGSSYDNPVAGIRDYLKATTGVEADDFAVVDYVRTNYTKLVDTDAQGGNDKLVGSHNDDILIGGPGNDTLSGNAGKDIFVFAVNSNSGKDIITDFTKGMDKIVLADAKDTSALKWDAENSTLSFTGVKDGHTYENSIVIQNASVDLKLEDIVTTAGIV